MGDNEQIEAAVREGHESWGSAVGGPDVEWYVAKAAFARGVAAERAAIRLSLSSQTVSMDAMPGVEWAIGQINRRTPAPSPSTPEAGGAETCKRCHGDGHQECVCLEDDPEPQPTPTEAGAETPRDTRLDVPKHGRRRRIGPEQPAPAPQPETSPLSEAQIAKWDDEYGDDYPHVRALAAEVRRLREQNEALQTGHGVYQRAAQRAREETREARAEVERLICERKKAEDETNAHLQQKLEVRAALARAVTVIEAFTRPPRSLRDTDNAMAAALSFLAEHAKGGGGR
jgi:hypothetical protein